MENPIFAILDFETTGLNNPVGSDQVIEMAVIKTDLERHYGTYHTYVKLSGGRTVSEFITNLTGITAEMTETGILEEAAFENLFHFIYGGGMMADDPIVVAQFTPFDFSFMSQYEIYPHKFLDTRSLSRMLDPNEKASLNDVHLRLFGKPVEKHHTALGDVLATEQVLKRQLERAAERGSTYKDFLNVVVGHPSRPLNFVPRHADLKVIGR